MAVMISFEVVVRPNGGVSDHCDEMIGFILVEVLGRQTCVRRMLPGSVEKLYFDLRTCVCRFFLRDLEFSIVFC